MAQSLEPGAALKQARESATYSAAMPCAEQALALARQEFTGDSPEFAVVLREVADIYNQFPEGFYQVKPLLERALDIQKMALGLRHPEVAATLFTLADFWRVHSKETPLFKQGSSKPMTPPNSAQLDSASALHDEADRHLFGAEQPRAGWPESDSGKAARLLVRALQIRRQELGPQHPTVLRTFNSLADVYERYLKQGIQAEACYRYTLEMAEKNPGEERWQIASHLLSLGEFYLRAHRYEDAELLLEEALAILEKDQGPSALDLTYVLKALAKLYIALERPDAAEHACRRAIAGFVALFGSDSLDLEELLVAFAGVLQQQGQPGEALVQYQRVKEIRQNRYGPESRKVTEVDEMAKALRELAWQKASPIEGRDPKRWRRDEHGNTIYKAAYGTRGKQGWEIDQDFQPLHRAVDQSDPD